MLRSSRDGLDIHRRLKRLDAAAAEEDRARKAALSSGEGSGGYGGGRRARDGGGSGSKVSPLRRSSEQVYLFHVLPRVQNDNISLTWGRTHGAHTTGGGDSKVRAYFF